MKIKADLHVHSDNSFDGRSSLDDIARAARECGLDAVAITDHNVFTLSEPERRHGVLLIPGCEISTQEGHVTALFCRPFDVFEELRKDGLPTLSQAADSIHAHGGAAVLAHPFAKKGGAEDSFAAFVDGTETANARAYFKNENANRDASDFAAENGLRTLGGSDAHHASEVGNCYTVLEYPDGENPGRGAVECTAVFIKNTSYIGKGLSQFKRRMREKSLKSFCVGSAYIVYCLILDFFALFGGKKE